MNNSRYLRAALFRRPLRRDILNKANALPPVSLLDPTKNCSLSFTRELFNGLLELDCDRVIADRDSVMTEGMMRMAYPGRTLLTMGIEVDDPDAYYLYESRMCVVWPVDASSGKLVGEETYTGTDGFAGIADRKIRAEDIVPLSI